MTLEDTTLHEVQCFECGKPISSIPPWLAGAKVQFQCEECRQKHPRVPGMADLEPRRASASAHDEAGDSPEVVEIDDDQAEEDLVEDGDEPAEE